MYHRGNRELQARFGSTALADRLLDKTHRIRFSDADREFIESREFFFLATADDEGRPDCSFKAGRPKIVSEDTLVFPDFDGNGMFKSLGNLRVNPGIGLLFIALDGSPKRLRVNGRAEVAFEDPWLEAFPGAQALVRVEAQHIFPNCPRYIPDLPGGAPSPYLPTVGAEPLEPAWKSFDDFRDVVPPRYRR